MLLRFIIFFVLRCNTIKCSSKQTPNKIIKVFSIHSDFSSSSIGWHFLQKKSCFERRYLQYLFTIKQEFCSWAKFSKSLSKVVFNKVFLQKVLKQCEPKTKNYMCSTSIIFYKKISNIKLLARIFFSHEIFLKCFWVLSCSSSYLASSKSVSWSGGVGGP